jgi:cytochrome oxidase Cu insertion factor (SCO1/SenC/PrrC family)
MAAKNAKGNPEGRTVPRSRAGWAVLVGAAAVAALVWLAMPHGGTAAAVRPTGRVGSAIGDTAPVLRVHDIQGQTVGLGGKPTVLYFMASWCSSCTYGESQLRQAQSRLGSRVNLVSIDVDPVHDTPAALAAFERQYGGEWPHVLDAGQRLVSAFGIRSLDTTLILNPGGTIVYEGGPQSGSALVQTLKGLLRG